MARTTYRVTSDRWGDPVNVTFAGLQKLAEYFTRDRQAQCAGDGEYPGDVTVEETTRNGQGVVVDDTGEVIAVATTAEGKTVV